MLNLLVLADLYNTLGDFDNAVWVIKRGSRWLQGRGDQRYWDLLEDDREFDIEGFNRAAPLMGARLNDPSSSNPSSSSGPAGSNNLGAGTVEMQSGYFPLDVNARHRLAVARIKMGDATEGIVRVFPIFLHSRSLIS